MIETQIQKPRQSVGKKVIIIGLLIGLFLTAFALWRHFQIPVPVTEAEAREFILEVNDRVNETPQEFCKLALFEKKCLRTAQDPDVIDGTDDGPAPAPQSAPTVVCTWTLKSAADTRVLEIENIDHNGDPYRTSFAVSRDGKELKGWPMPYWDFPTRQVPDALSGGPTPTVRPDEVDLGIEFDPCLMEDQAQGSR